MLAHNLKDILSILPDLQGHIKQANVEEDFPLDNKDSCLASYVRCQYLIKVAGKPVEPETLALIEKAATLYGIKEQASEFGQKLEKYAMLKRKQIISESETLNVKQAEAIFEGNLSAFVDLEKAASEARQLVTTYGDQITSEEVKRYAGKAYFDKEAAVQAMHARAYATGKPVFEKVAEILEKSIDDKITEKEIQDVCEKVTQLDKKAGLHLKGFNIYKEALVVKEAAVRSILSVNICGRPVPYEKIAMFGKDRIGSVLGTDVSDAMTGNPVHDKQVIESLPLDSQRVLQGVLRSV